MNGGGIGVPNLKGEGSVVSVGQHSNNGPDSCDLNTIQRTCSLFGLDLVSYFNLVQLFFHFFPYSQDTDGGAWASRDSEREHPDGDTCGECE